MPCHPARARQLLSKGRAVVARMYPFTIRIKDRDAGDVQPIVLGIDPGSKATGLAVARVDERGVRHALWLGELQHRGAAIHKAMGQRAGYRRRRRSANLRYRAPRFSNRRPKRPLAPSLMHRVETTQTWADRLRRLAPISTIAVESVKFDTQALQNPEISGVEYQQGTMAGYELREYLLEKWGRKCAYCDVENVPLELDHIVPKCDGGSDRAPNRTLACHDCNQRKGKRPVQEFLAGQPRRLARILAQAKAPLRDAAAVNSTRRVLVEQLAKTGIPVEAATGGRTKWNRVRFGVPKTHALDALCVGECAGVLGWNVPVLVIRATGRGAYQRTRVTASGFPRGILTRQKRIHGFQTGDTVRAVVPTGKKKGVHVGRVAVRATGSFNIQTPHNVVQGISHKYCRLIARSDGYGYDVGPLPPAVNGGASAPTCMEANR